MAVQGKAVEDRFQVCDHIPLLLLEGMEHRHQHATGAGSSVRLRTEAELAGDDGGPQIALGEVVLGRDAPVVSPVLEPLGLGPEDLLEAADAEVLRRRFHRSHDLGLQA